MSVVIYDKVGRACRNLVPDVKAIQDALNRVPFDQGGTPPYKKLTVDGNCGGKTIEAIQLFQLKQFGWPGSDGKVFPQGQTHIRLNQILGQQTEAPSIPGPQTEPITNAFMIRMSIKGVTLPSFSMDDDLYMIIEDAANMITATYKVSLSKRLQPDSYSFPEIMPWSGDSISVSAFENADFKYTTVAIPAIEKVPVDVTGGVIPLDTVVCENTMEIRLSGESGFKRFLWRKVFIREAYGEAMIRKQAAQAIIEGKMERVS